MLRFQFSRDKREYGNNITKTREIYLRKNKNATHIIPCSSDVENLSVTFQVITFRLGIVYGKVYKKQ